MYKEKRVGVSLPWFMRPQNNYKTAKLPMTDVSHAERGWEAFLGQFGRVTSFPRNLSINSNTLSAQ